MIVGASKIEQLEANVKASGVTLAEEAWAEAERALA